MVLDILTATFKGILVSDYLATYDVIDADKAKCAFHDLPACKNAEKDNIPGVLQFVPKAKELVQDAMTLRKRQSRIDPQDYSELVAWVELGLDLLLDQTYSQAADIRLANRLRKHRRHVFTFLYRADVDATNNLGERQIRPGVIIRKISAGNRTLQGATTHEVIASVAATCAEARSVLRGHEHLGLASFCGSIEARVSPPHTARTAHP